MKMVLALNYLQWLICHKTKQKSQKSCWFCWSCDLGIGKNNGDIIITFITAKVYNALLLNCIRPEIEKILRKNLNSFQRNHSTTSKIRTIYRTIKSKYNVYDIPKEIITPIMILYKKKKATAHLMGTQFFDFFIGVLLGDTRIIK